MKIQRNSHLRYIYNNELDKSYFAHTYSNSKYSAKITISEKNLKERAYKIAITLKCDKYQRELAIMVYKFFDKNVGSEVRANVNEVLAQELHKPIIKNFRRTKGYSRFKNNI